MIAFWCNNLLTATILLTKSIWLPKCQIRRKKVKPQIFENVGNDPLYLIPLQSVTVNMQRSYFKSNNPFSFNLG
jgi:hypothetical protein